ncbi:hypothetical protein N2152v2_009986 [Parachlorella kessleri]
MLKLICSSLILEDRVAFISCCRRLWACLGVTNSSRLWGVIEAELVRGKDADISSYYSVSLGHWLARHKAAVGRLSVQGYLDGANPAGVLAALEGGALAALELRRMDAVGANPAAALAPLAHLTGLTELQLLDCDVWRLPPQLSALTALKMTALRLQCCGLRRLPQQLSALAASLQTLCVADNHGNFGGWVIGSMVCPLNSLSALTSLDMAFCRLPCIPPQLTAMGSLQQLQLLGNDMTSAQAQPWEPLRRLSRLTYLDLGDCHLACLPQQLSCLTALAELHLSFNPGLGRFLGGHPTGAEASSWQPLLSLSASLTSLQLRGCKLAALPAGFSSLSALVSLDLSRNHGLGEAGDSAFEPLSGLVSVRVLKLNMMELKCIPPQLKLLPALEELQVWGNKSLGKQGPALGRQLMELPALKRLDFGYGIDIATRGVQVLGLMSGT